MDKLSKLLKKLTQEERKILEATLLNLLSGDVASFDIKKLRGVKNVYRVRIGTLRIIFSKNKDDIQVLDVSRRSEKTYKDF